MIPSELLKQFEERLEEVYQASKNISYFVDNCEDPIQVNTVVIGAGKLMDEHYKKMNEI